MWNNLIDFFIVNFFGGVTSNGLVYSGFIGPQGSTRSLTFNFFGVSISIGNYLSFLATIITMVIIFVLCCLFVAKIIKLIGNLIK